MKDMMNAPKLVLAHSFERNRASSHLSRGTEFCSIAKVNLTTVGRATSFWTRLSGLEPKLEFLGHVLYHPFCRT